MNDEHDRTHTRWVGYGGHYYIPPANTELALDTILRRVSVAIEKSGPQLIHFHAHDDACLPYRHMRCDESGNRELEPGELTP